MGITFYHAERTLDNDLEKIHCALRSHVIDKILYDIFDGETRELKLVHVDNIFSDNKLSNKQ